MFDINEYFTHDGAGGLSQSFAADVALSTNVKDLGADGMQIAGGHKKPSVFIHVTTAFTGAASGVKITLEDADNAAISSNARVLWRSGILNVSQLAAGTVIEIPLPAVVYKRYLGVRLAKVSEAVTAGIWQVRLGHAPERNIAATDMDDTV